MHVTERTTLIIDANNLAHYLDHLPPGQHLSAEEIFRLAVHLTNYAHQAQPPVIIELCIDPLPPDTEVPLLPWVRCLVAAARSSADDLLRERFRFHQHRGERSIVITNDGEVREDIEDEGGECLLGYDFVRRSGESPVFRQPDEFKAVRARHTTRPAKKLTDLDWDRLLLHAAPGMVTTTPKQAEETGDQPGSIPSDATKEVSNSALCEENTTQDQNPAPEPTETVYRLTFENWPAESGLRFLLDSFCQEHQQDEDWQLYQSLAAGDIRPADLRDLAILLREHCGNEPGFAQHGSLMKQMRLALIQSNDFQLSLSNLIAKTGLNARGLKGRIREKAGPWIEIIEPGE